MKTSELIGTALDWAVAKCEDKIGNIEVHAGNLWYGQVTSGFVQFHPSTNWSQGGLIIEREMITVGPAKHEGFMAWAWPKKDGVWGDTPLIAAMRCYVMSKLGNEIEIPEELK